MIAPLSDPMTAMGRGRVRRRSPPMTGQFPGSRAETSDTLSGAMGLVVFVSVGAFVQPQSRPAGKGSSNERPESLRDR